MVKNGEGEEREREGERERGREGATQRERERERDEIIILYYHTNKNEPYTVVAFIITSLLVLYFNIGVPNELRGCLFFVQVSVNTCVHLRAVHITFTSFSILLYYACMQVVGFVYQSSRTEEITWVQYS